jgi:hypothetical protein
MMNCKLPDVVSDIEGAGAMKIMRGNRTEKIICFLNLNLFKASKEELLESLKGNYRPCLVNVLKEKLVEYDFFVSQMRKYEQDIISILEHISELKEQKR